MSFQVQDIIHGFTQGAGARIFKVLFVLIVVVAVGALYDTLVYRNFANREAMDMAQLGRNLAQGKGYTTLYVRPFSMFLLQQHRNDHSPELKTDHPDITNPPVYPYLLAGLFKALPAKYFTTAEKGFTIYIPDMAVAFLNQFLLLIGGILLFFLAEKLFDTTIAWITAILYAGTEVFWHFSVAGLSTMLLIVLLLALAWVLVWLEQWTRYGRSDVLLVGLAIFAGVLVGAGGLTRYSFGWLIVPLLLFFISFFGKKRAVFALAALGGFLAVMGPWVARNYSVSGMPFGTATFAVCQGTGTFPEDRLERALKPELRKVTYVDFARKLLANTREVFQEVPKMAGSWIASFFLVGLLVPFRSLSLSRLRWFLLFSLVVFGVVQAMGRTTLSTESPEINSENLLVLLAPLIFMYGAALFFLLIDSIALPFPSARLVLMVSFCLVGALPLLHTLLPPHPSPIAYPPYYPPLLQRIAGWFNEKELIMSDMPWAMAWYGRRQSLLVTLNWREDVIEITDYHKPIKGLYLTTLTTDSKFLSNWVKGDNSNWASFLLESLVLREVPKGFPLRRAPEGLFPEQLLLTDYDRWRLKKE
ncbi:MAG: hypothetical protein HZA90_24450 [Verrucomicrobia bacterium]|nr:hypothetical protein [Verrucomicrobiota bacterium]